MITQLDKNIALVLIDLQRALVIKPAIHPIKEILANASRLANAFRQRNLPVVIVSVNPFGAPWTLTRKEKSGMPTQSFINKLAKGAMTISGLTNSAIETAPEDIRITKHTWNAFFETPLHAELQHKGITQIVLGGISTSIGVEGTARAASELGYNIAFATDAMTDYVAEAHNNSLKNIFPRIGELGTSDEILHKL
jgi:nicotinamidase-related amidase